MMYKIGGKSNSYFLHINLYCPFSQWRLGSSYFTTGLLIFWQNISCKINIPDNWSLTQKDLTFANWKPEWKQKIPSASSGVQTLADVSSADVSFSVFQGLTRFCIPLLLPDADLWLWQWFRDLGGTGKLPDIWITGVGHI